MMGETINCSLVGEGVVCNGTLYSLPEPRLSYEDMWFWIYLAIYALLVLIAGLVSGLTMGLLSLDMMTLKVLKDGGTPKERKYAARIIPVVKRHHLLLVTLLLVNAGAVEAMPIFLDRISDPITAICVSVTAVLIFGEVFPQALCTRFGLAIGATLTPLVYLLMGLVFIIAWPISKFLDCLLGHDHDTFYRRAQLKVLVDLHGQTDTVPDHGSPAATEHLTVDEVLIIKGALDMKDKVVEDAMLPLDDVYMLSVDTKLDKATMTSMQAASHSRIPIYSDSKENVVGLVLVKQLIQLNPDDATPVSQLMSDPICFRKVPTVYSDLALFDLLNLFQTGKSHLCLVKRRSDEELMVNAENSDISASPSNESVVGIITLEDVIEELIQEEIVDETDVYVDIQKRVRVARAKASKHAGKTAYEEGLPKQRSMSDPEGKSVRPGRNKARRQMSDDPLIDVSSDVTSPLLSHQEQ